jgi:mRNA interferase MazF
VETDPEAAAYPVRRGEVYWAELAPRSGSEQRGRRPVIVVSNDGFNVTPAWRSVIVVPVSSASNQARRGPTAVALPSGVAGLERTSLALCHQVTTLDRAKLTARLGTLPAPLLASVEDGLRAALDLE